MSTPQLAKGRAARAGGSPQTGSSSRRASARRSSRQTIRARCRFKSEAADRLADDASMAAFNNEFPNAEALPIYRIAGSYFPKSAYVASLTRPDLGAIWNAISAVYGTAYNDSVVTVDSVRGGPTAGWRGCEVFKAVHANSKWLSSFRDKAGCVLPRRSGKKGAAAIDELIMKKIIEDVRGVEDNASVTLPSWLEAPVITRSAGAVQ